jgi:hypothetical protein
MIYNKRHEILNFLKKKLQKHRQDCNLATTKRMIS